jgi:hypothetical protein
MPGHREEILAYLRRHLEGADDDELARSLGINPRQTVNRICRALAAANLIERRQGAEGKIINRAVDSTGDLPAYAPSPGTVPAPSVSREPSIVAVERLIALRDVPAVQGFSYPGEKSISEDQVKAAAQAALQADGWSVEVRWGHEPGIDIVARRGGERWVIEAKGEGSLSAMRVNYFVGALGELVQRMDSPDAHYALAFPAHRQFVGLVLRLPEWVRQRLDLSVFLVRPAENGTWEVGVVPAGTLARL